MIIENRLYIKKSEGTSSLEHSLFENKFDLKNLCDWKVFIDRNGNKIIQIHQLKSDLKKVKYNINPISDNTGKKYKKD